MGSLAVVQLCSCAGQCNAVTVQWARQWASWAVEQLRSGQLGSGQWAGPTIVTSNRQLILSGNDNGEW